MSEEGKAQSGQSAGGAGDEKYAIPQVVREKYPDLVKLIKDTESMNDEEREYWFQILPIMTDEQVQKLRDILANEKKQLAKLDEEYEDELNQLNKKHLVEWEEFEAAERRKKLHEMETKSEKEEKEIEDKLLGDLGEI